VATKVKLEMPKQIHMKLLARLSRITTSGREFIPQIDGLRFVAIIAVIAFHVWSIGTFHLGHAGDRSNIVGQCLVSGSCGVQLFFMISGFILALPFAKQHLAGGKTVRLRDYFKRRLTRIEPPYIIQMVFVFAFAALVLRWSLMHQHIFGGESWWRYTTPHMLASLVYAHDFIYKEYPYPNIVLWSLEIEVQFYIVAPLLACLFVIRHHWGRRILIALLVLAWPWLISFLGLEPVAARVWLLKALPNFLTGFLLVEFYLTGWLGAAKKSFIWDLVCLLCGPALIFGRLQILPDALEPWTLLLLAVAVFRGRLASWLLSNPWTTTIGGMCYTIYMYHWLLIAVIIRATIHLQTGTLWLDLLVQFLVLTPSIILVSAFLFAWFERPFMRRDWPTRFKQFLLGHKTAPGVIRVAGKLKLEMPKLTSIGK